MTESEGTAFGEWLRGMRVRAGHTQMSLAAAMEEASGHEETVEQTRISKMESGRIRSPTGTDVRLFAKVLGVSEATVLRAAGLMSEGAEGAPSPRFPPGSYRATLDAFLDQTSERDAEILCRLAWGLVGDERPFGQVHLEGLHGLYDEVDDFGREGDGELWATKGR